MFIIGITSLADLPDKLLSQCGIVNAVLVTGIVWLAMQLAKTRASWETDRAGMLKMHSEQTVALEKVATSNAKLEGMLLAVQRDGSRND